MIRGVALIAVLACTPVALAARPGEILVPGADLTLEEGEGHAVIVFDLLDRLDQLRFTGPGEWVTKLKFQTLQPGISTVALRMPSGLYCIDTFRAGKVRFHRTDERSLGNCFAVTPGVLNYAGHLSVRAKGDGSKDAVHRWDFKPELFLAHMARDYPELLARHSDLRFGLQNNISTLDFALAALEAGDSTLGLRLLEASAAQGNAFARYELALRAFEGNGVPQDRARAIAIFDELASAGDKRGAQANCILLQHPDYEGARLADARRYCQMGADAGDARSMVQLAAMHRDGRGGAKVDAVRAFQLSKAAAEAGDAEGQFQAGVALRDGIGTAPDLAGAIAWFEKGIAGDNPGALHAMGLLLDQGRGMHADPQRAFELFERAARAGHVEASVAVADAYWHGRGVAKDLTRADDLLNGISRRSPEGALAYAWFQATCADPAFRNSRAARNASGAMYALEKKQPGHYAIRAAALADAGDFIGAKRDAQRAIDEGLKTMRPDDPRILAWREQLATYKREQPWREP